MSKPPATVHTLEPTGWTGGRVYLRMVHEALRDAAEIHTVPDPKRQYRRRRWRKLRHLAVLTPQIHRLRDAPGLFIWDDLSLLWFTPAMRRRTLYIFHHHDPQQYDSAPIEPMLWKALYAALRDCAAVVCVSPFWARHLAAHGVHAQIIYNAFDTTRIAEIRSENPLVLRHRFALPDDRLLVYVGKAVHGKGVEHAERILASDPRFCLVSTGNNTIGARTRHLGWLPYLDHLRVIRACDVGLFLSTLQEGWNRCAAEAILLERPSITSASGGLGDLGALTGQPTARLRQLDDQILTRVATPPTELIRARRKLEAFDLAGFSTAWRNLVQAAATASFVPQDAGPGVTEGRSRPR